MPCELYLSNMNAHLSPIVAASEARFRGLCRIRAIAGLLALSAGGVQSATINTQWKFDDAANSGSSVANVGGYVGTFISGVSRSAGGQGVSGTPGDYALAMSGVGAGSMMDATTPEFINDLNILTGSQQMSITWWQNLNAITNSTAFWGQSTSVARGLNAHTPWGDSNTYFDTSGCCGPTQRISGPLNATLGEWQLITMTYDNGSKAIYRDTTLIASNGGYDPLVTDLTNFYVGNESPTALLDPNARYDNFTLWDGALTPAEIAVLAVRPVPEPFASVLVAAALCTLRPRRRVCQ
jgi:Concanavalin A-like lectin/glucanases superfamily